MPLLLSAANAGADAPKERMATAENTDLIFFLLLFCQRPRGLARFVPFRWTHNAICRRQLFPEYG
jgi:hypothetical protein